MKFGPDATGVLDLRAWGVPAALLGMEGIEDDFCHIAILDRRGIRRDFACDHGDSKNAGPLARSRSRGLAGRRRGWRNGPAGNGMFIGATPLAFVRANP